MIPFTIGPHQIEIEEDVFVVRWRGDPEFKPLVAVYDRLAEFIAARGYALVLFDLRQAGLPGGEVRRYTGQWWRQQKPYTAVLATYGMSAPVRTVITLINRALTLFRGPGPAAVALFSGEADARSWLAAQRPRLVATQAPSAPPPEGIR